MKAIDGTRNGALRLRDFHRSEPSEGELLVKMAYATVTRGDVIMHNMPRALTAVLGALFGFKAMDIPGVEFSGTIEAVGDGVGDFSPGDRVAGTATGLRYGANAEYLCVPARSRSGVLAKVDKALALEKAAPLAVGGMTAMQILGRLSGIKGKSLMVYGCSGSVGSYVAQLAQHRGARVTGVCSSSSIAAVRGLGMDRLLDYREDEWKKQRVDILIDAVGKLSRKQAKQLINPGGQIGSVRRPTKEINTELEELLEMAKEGNVTAIIDREITLEGVAQAHAYVASGRKKGNILVRVHGE